LHGTDTEHRLALGLAPPSMTRTVRELELDGLITLETDDSDRRVTRIRATAKGEQLLKQGRGARIYNPFFRLFGRSAPTQRGIDRPFKRSAWRIAK
jgi:DNA-binding PadR family transcriptional regulator